MKLKRAILLVVVLAVSIGLACLSGCGAKEDASREELWRAAVEDAVISDDDEVMDLVTLTADDERVIWDDAGERVLLLTWHDYDDECEPGDDIDTEALGDIWATSAGEMREWYEMNGEGVEDWALRFAQLLGVHEDEGYTRFTAFWISPEDVIRPAYVTDVTAQMENDYGLTGEGQYKEWFDDNIIWSYFESDYPWTRLGYTYDWSNGESEYGLTEFLVSDGSKAEIAFTYTTEDFVKWLKGQAGTEGSPLHGEKVAYIMQMAPSEIFQMWSASAEETASRLGMEYDAFFCNGSDEKWMETAERCAEEGYDGLLLSHGGEGYSYEFLSGLLEQYPDLKITTFDTFFQDDEGNSVKIDGVTQFFQQDSRMAEELLDYICNTLYEDKIKAGEPVNILKVWVGPDYLAAFDRREEGYARYEEEGLINTVETIGPSDFEDAENSMKEVMAAALEKYRDDEIDAIWCCYDLYAQGVYEALAEAGRDIPMVSVDISGHDMEMMTAENSPWKACATTNWHNNGEFGMRVLALEMNGDYGKIVDPSSGEASDWLEIPVSVITQDMISGKDVDIDSLGDVAGDEYSERWWMPTADWMAEFLGD